MPKEYLHSAELRDIMQFGSSSTAVFFKMRVAGVLHIFQFETRQGEDICMALQTHINDIMMKRCAAGRRNGVCGGLGASPTDTAGRLPAPSSKKASAWLLCLTGASVAAHVRGCRYSKAKASATADKGQQQLGLAQGNFGPKYEAHVAQLQSELEELRKKIQAMQRQEADIR